MRVEFELDHSGAFNEMFERPGHPRPLYRPVVEELQRHSMAELHERRELLARTFSDRGVTFAFSGEERPFPLDLLPRLIAGFEWDLVAQGIAQRVRALEAFLDDVYGDGRIFDEGIIPRSVITSSPNFVRAASGIRPSNGARITVSGVDLIRDEQGNFRVLEDNVRIPSGVSYVIENRRAMTQHASSLFSAYRVQPVDEYPSRLLAALRSSGASADPVVVVLTPGVHNAAYFEHVLLARMMGAELVEGSDLVCRSNKVYMRTTHGERRVHAIYRRVDDEWLDPLHFRPDSMVGVPGLVNAARAGNVSIANALGNGVADDKLVYTYVPDFIRYYLAEAPLLDNVETYRLEDEEIRADVLSNLERFVVKPVDGSGGKGIVIGHLATERDLAEAGEAISAAPRNWIAQRPVALSTLPSLTGDSLGARHIDLRPFAINDGEEVWVLPGGLTRVALERGELVVNSSKGGGSKDTWVVNATNALGHLPAVGQSPAVESSILGRTSLPFRQSDPVTRAEDDQ
jgi:uncharacterized circularly permuted ATP-grasp superfamily protein